MESVASWTVVLILVIVNTVYVAGNSAPTFLTHTYPVVRDVDEGTGTPSGSELHVFTVTDPDGGTYTMSYTYDPADSEDMFTITADTGAGTYTVTLASGKEFDYETVNSYTITARAFDGVDSATAKITVVIEDVGEAPTLVPDTPFQIFTIDEDTLGTYIGSPSFTISDLDDLETHTFSINASLGNGSDYINIDPTTGGISLKQDYDRDVPGMGSDVWVHVDIIDKLGLSATTTFSLVVNDLNDNTPYFNVTTTDVTIERDMATGTTLAVLGASDDDAESPNNDVTLVVDDSETGSYFEMDGFELKLKIQLDVADGTTGLTFNVYAIDGGTTPRTGTATINVILPASTSTSTTTLVPPVGYSWLDDTTNVILLTAILVIAAFFLGYCCLLCWRFNTFGKCLPEKCPDKIECHAYFERCCVCCRKKPPDEPRSPRGASASAISFTMASERGTPLSFNAEPFIIGKKGLPGIPAPAPVATSLQKKPKADLMSGQGKWVNT